jgi:hypothetical protein
MLRVQISLWSLSVVIESEMKYPDQIDDIINRAGSLFITGMMAAKNQDLDISQVQLIDYNGESTPDED